MIPTIERLPLLREGGVFNFAMPDWGIGAIQLFQTLTGSTFLSIWHKDLPLPFPRTYFIRLYFCQYANWFVARSIDLSLSVVLLKEPCLYVWSLRSTFLQRNKKNEAINLKAREIKYYSYYIWLINNFYFFYVPYPLGTWVIMALHNILYPSEF